MLRCSFKKDDGNRCKIKTLTVSGVCHVHENSPECSICYEKINKTNIYESKCNHSFHVNCIEKWLERYNTCPLCREDLPHKKYKVSISDDPLLKQFTPSFGSS